MTVVYIRLVVEACTTCRGTGEILAGGPAGGGHATRPKRCPKCDGIDAFDVVDKLLDRGVPQESINRRGLRVTSATSRGERDVIRDLASTAGTDLKAARDAFERCDEAWRAAGPLAPHDLVMERLRLLDELIGAAKVDGAQDADPLGIDADGWDAAAEQVCGCGKRAADAAHVEGCTKASED